MSFKNIILDRINSKDAVISIIGMGYVGLPLAMRFSEVGFKVNGIDINNNKIKLLNSGSSPIKSVRDSQLKKVIKNNFFHASSEYSCINESDLIIICVPTPLGKHNEPDLSYVQDALNKIKPNTREGQTISLESTTYPGTTSDIIVPALEDLGYIVGKDVFVLNSPEREDPGNKKFKLETIPKVVGGHTKNCLEIGKAFYSNVVESVVEVSSTDAAEMTKLLENIYRSVNIGLVNELKVVASAMNIDIYEVIDAAATKPFGYTPFYPGPGLGGHCIPIDPFYLTWRAKEFGLNTKFIELAGEVNSNMPNWVAEQILLALNSVAKPVKDSKILIMGIAYKKNIDDLRESPALVIMERLNNLGANIDYCDPHVVKFHCEYEKGGIMHSKSFKNLKISSYDMVVILTDHDDFDYDKIEKESKMIFDTRGIFRNSKKKIYRA